MTETQTWLKVGNKVWWSDPDHDLSSGEYEILEIQTNPDDNNALYDDTIILIGNDVSEVEVWAAELKPIKN